MSNNNNIKHRKSCDGSGKHCNYECYREDHRWHNVPFFFRSIKSGQLFSLTECDDKNCKVELITVLRPELIVVKEIQNE